MRLRLLNVVLLISLLPAYSLAQRGGGGGHGGGGGGGSRGVGGGGGGFRGGAVGGGGARGFSGGYGGGYRGGYGGYRGGYGYGRYGYGFGFGLGLGLGFGWPYWGYGYGWPYYGYGGYYDPGYYDPGYGYDYGYSAGGYAPAYGSGYAAAPAQTYAQTYAPPVVINQNIGSGGAPSQGSYYRKADYYLIAFNDHTIQAATSYSVDGDTLHYTTREGVQKTAPVSSVDLRFSQQMNRDRRVDFELQNPQQQPPH